MAESLRNREYQRVTIVYKTKAEFIAAETEFAVGIMGNPRTSDFELIDVKKPLPEDLAARCAARSLLFIGAAGILNGVPQTALEVPLDKSAIALVAAAYLAYIENAMNAALEAKWLQRLYVLPDPRAN